MACLQQLLSRLRPFPSRFAPPRNFTPSSDEGFRSNARHPNGIPTRYLRVEYTSPPESSRSDEDFRNLFQPLLGFEEYYLTTYIHRTTREAVQITQIVFDTQANAATGAETLHQTRLNSSTFHLSFLPGFSNSPWDEDFEAHNPDLERAPQPPSLTIMEDGPGPPARKKPKLSIPSKITCKICTSEITGACSKPCLRCKEAWCLDCVKTWFIHATQDSIERMPARCCNLVMHHGVAGSTLSTVEYELYKIKYDEHTTPNPLYCPVPTCSTFIPPRLIDPSKETVNCTLCTTCICTKCKQIAAADHICEEEATAVKIKALNYKRCPKCGTGVMRMYGCPHIRCACGCHFCYDCLRPINICYRSPCQSAIEDGQYGDEDDGELSDSEDGIEDVGIAAETTHVTPNAQPNPATNPQRERSRGPNTLQAVFNVFRGRRRRRLETEERPNAVESAVQMEPSEVEPQTVSELDTASIDHASSTSMPLPLDILAEVASREQQQSLIPEASGPPVTLPRSASAPELATHLSDDAAVDSPVSADAQISTSEPSSEGPEDPFVIPLPLVTVDLAAELPVAELPVAELPVAELPVAEPPNTELNESDFETRPNPAVIPNGNTPATEPATPNLDDPDLLDWEAGDYDFGEEPVDEAFDVWGCACNFNKLKKSDVDEHWMDLTYLDCMKCFGEVILQTTPQLYSGVGGIKNFKDKLAWHCAKCGIVVCGACQTKKKGEVKGLMRAHGRAQN